MSVWTRNYTEAAQNALQAVAEAWGAGGAGGARLAALLAAAQLERLVPATQRRLAGLLHRYIYIMLSFC